LRSLGLKGFSRKESAPAFLERMIMSGEGLAAVTIIGTLLYLGFIPRSSASLIPFPGMSTSTTIAWGKELAELLDSIQAIVRDVSRKVPRQHLGDQSSELFPVDNEYVF